MADDGCTYAVVDMSKKNKNRSTSKKEKEDVEETGMALYSMVEKCNFNLKEQDELHADTSFASKAEDAIPSANIHEAIVSTKFNASEKSKEKLTTNSKQSTTIVCFFLAIAAAFIVLAIISFVCIGILFAEIKSMKFETVTVMQEMPDTSDKLYCNETRELVGLLATSLFSLESETLQLEDDLRRLVGQFENIPASSCTNLPHPSPSGYYWIRNSIGSAVRVYCDMDRSCGNVTGVWRRVAELDMTNRRQRCPNGLRQRNYNSNIRTCVRNRDSSGCSMVRYRTANIQYSRVCGKVIAYQYGTTNAFGQRITKNNAISSAYVDGVSLTHGDPREHIWTFAAALGENADAPSSCHCITSDAPLPPSFVGMDYFCDTGLQTFDSGNLPGFLGADPLWDGEGCEAPNNCCTFNTPPWFHKQLPRPTTDDIEMRMCRDDAVDNEDVAIEKIEIYVQ